MHLGTIKKGVYRPDKMTKFGDNTVILSGRGPPKIRVFYDSTP